LPAPAGGYLCEVRSPTQQLRSDFRAAPTLRLRPLEFEPDVVRRDLYDLEIGNVTDPALHALFRASETK